MVTAQDKFKSLIKERLAPELKASGFRLRDSTFRREHNGAWQIINLQRSQFSNAGDVSLTVNLGAALPTLQPDPTWAKRGWPLEYRCDFRQRFGPAPQWPRPMVASAAGAVGSSAQLEIAERELARWQRDKRKNPA